MSSSARKLTFISTQRLQSPLILKRCVSSSHLSSLIQRRDKSTVPSAATSRHPALEAAIDHAALFDSAHSYVRSPLSVSPAVFSHNSPIRPVRSDPPPSLKSVPVDGTITFPPYAQNGIVPPSLNPHRITLHNESSAQSKILTDLCKTRNYLINNPTSSLSTCNLRTHIVHPFSAHICYIYDRRYQLPI